jgi:hypothetical protein
MTVKLCTIAEDGLPDMDALTGRVAFIFDGCVVSGWPLYPKYSNDVEDWEADTDVGINGTFKGVKKYLIFDKPLWEL